MPPLLPLSILSPEPGLVQHVKSPPTRGLWIQPDFSIYQRKLPYPIFPVNRCERLFPLAMLTSNKQKGSIYGVIVPDLRKVLISSAEQERAHI